MVGLLVGPLPPTPGWLAAPGRRWSTPASSSCAWWHTFARALARAHMHKHCAARHKPTNPGPIKSRNTQHPLLTTSPLPPPRRRLSELKKGEREALLTALTCWPLPITGHKGYALAEVTGGGVPLNEVDCSSMESRLQPGLHMCGEVLDVFGRIGGFNFLWAWVTGRAAGRAAARLAAAQPQPQGSAAGEQRRGRAAAAG